MRIIILFFIIFKSSFSFGQIVSYELQMPEPHSHYFEITMKLDGVKGKFIDLKLPVWTPGSYMIREYSKNVENVFAHSEDGSNLSVEKVNKNTWRVECKKQKQITVNYRVYAFEMSVRHSFLDDSHAYINGTTLFLFWDKVLDKPHELVVKPHPSFSKISTGLSPKNKENPWVLLANNYDELVDCPIEIGNHLTFEFEAAGTLHEVAIYGEGDFDIDNLKRDMAKIVIATTDVFGQNPNERYVFLIHNLNSGGGGLEHMNSTSLQVNRKTYDNEKTYKGFLSLVAHEYFHLWNVKRLRPKSLIEYDYNQENYTDLLWVFEGFTSYYDELLLLKAGFYTSEDYLDVIRRTINYIENLPGNQVQSLTQSSFDSWIKFYRSNENSLNTEISYYSKGALAALMIDLSIIDFTKGEKNLDDLMKVLYEKYYKHKNMGINHSDLLNELQLLTGKDFSTFLQEHIHGVKTFPYSEKLLNAGIQLTELLDEDEIEFGARFKSASNGIAIRNIKRGTTAHAGGINVNDEILSVNEKRITSVNDFNDLIKDLNVGDRLEIKISREGIVRSLQMPIKPSTKKSFKLDLVDNLSEEQTKNLLKWLRIQEL